MAEEMARITIRIPAWLKKEMEIRDNINWSQEIRFFLEHFFKKEEIPGELMSKIIKFKENGEWDVLKALFLYGVIYEDIGNPFKKNLSIMFDREDEENFEKRKEKTMDIEYKILITLKDLRIKDRYDRVFQNKPFYEVLINALMEIGFKEHMEEEINKAIETAENKEELRKALYHLGLYMEFNNTFKEEQNIDLNNLYTCFAATQIEILFSHIFEDPKKIIHQLNRMGIIYFDYYDSNAYSYEKYCIPIYSYGTIERILENNDIKYRLQSALSDEKSRAFLKQLKGDYTVDFYDEEKIKQLREDFDSKYGKGEFDNTLRELVQAGILVCRFFPHRSSAGGRGSLPARLYYNLSSVAKKYLVDVVLEKIAKPEAGEGELSHLIKVYEKS